MTPDGRPGAPCSGPASALLPPWLPAAAADHSPSLGGSGTLPSAGQLHYYCIMEYGFINFYSKNHVVQINFTDRLALHII
jgi:hypothetical protein